MPKKTIRDLDVTGKRVFIRADFNVPMDDDGRITDDRRVRLTIPTLLSVLDRGGSVVVASHLGRPDGTGFQASESARPVRDLLDRLLAGHMDGTVQMAGDLPTSPESAAAAAALKPRQVLLLENLRFEKGEKKGDPAFAAKLAGYADAYVNDAFGCSHRSDASMDALPRAMAPKPCVAGLLLERELTYLQGVLEAPRRPFVAIIGGAKVSDKIAALTNLCGRVDTILVGGAMAYTFMLAQGLGVGRSLVQPDMVDQARTILALAKQRGTALMLPTDHVCGAELKAGTTTSIVSGAIPDGVMGLDIGPSTLASYSAAVLGANTIVWNGPMGAFETAPFDAGTVGLARVVAQATERGCTSVAGGGDTASAVEQAGLAGALTHISTGGGASLEMLEGKTFACLAALQDA
ncbi:MAG: Phosphoglycerate kinase [Planctomycetota bacterium]|jgi:phosphoglycerate kinase